MWRSDLSQQENIFFTGQLMAVNNDEEEIRKWISHNKSNTCLESKMKTCVVMKLVAAMIYAAGTWTMSRKYIEKKRVAHHKSVRSVLKIKVEQETNKTGLKDIVAIVYRRKLNSRTHSKDQGTENEYL